MRIFQPAHNPTLLMLVAFGGALRCSRYMAFEIMEKINIRCLLNLGHWI